MDEENGNDINKDNNGDMLRGGSFGNLDEREM